MGAMVAKVDDVNERSFDNKTDPLSGTLTTTAMSLGTH